MDLKKIKKEATVKELLCCIITKTDSSIISCKKFGFLPLTKEIMDSAGKKNLPLFCDNKIKHHLICPSHRRMILTGARFNGSPNRLNLNQYEVGFQKELSMFLEEYSNYQKSQSLIKEKADLCEVLTSEKFKNLFKRYQSYTEQYDPSNYSLNEVEQPSLNERFRSEDETEINFDVLSAMSLKRYKKFFKLPNRPGTSSKIQLLEDIKEQVLNIPINQAETTAFFLYTLRNKLNVLDNPKSDEVILKRA